MLQHIKRGHRIIPNRVDHIIPQITCIDRVKESAIRIKGNDEREVRGEIIKSWKKGNYEREVRGEMIKSWKTIVDTKSKMIHYLLHTTNAIRNKNQSNAETNVMLII